MYPKIFGEDGVRSDKHKIVPQPRLYFKGRTVQQQPVEAVSGETLLHLAQQLLPARLTPPCFGRNAQRNCVVYHTKILLSGYRGSRSFVILQPCIMATFIYPKPSNRIIKHRPGIQISTNRHENIAPMGIPLRQVFELNMSGTQQPLPYRKPHPKHTQTILKPRPNQEQIRPTLSPKQTQKNALEPLIQADFNCHFTKIENIPRRLFIKYLVSIRPSYALQRNSRPRPVRPGP